MTIQIKQIKLREVRLPLKEPFKISSGTMDLRHLLLLEIQDMDGISVWSECVTDVAPNYSPETVETARLVIAKYIAPRVLGVRFESPASLNQEIMRHFRGHPMARAAVEMGAWCLEATRRGVSLSKLLGGTRSDIITGISIGIQPSPSALVEKVKVALAAGYPKIKIKIKPGSDLDYLKAVRKEFGRKVSLMVDANNAYTVKDFPHLKKLDELELLMLEQPLDGDDLVRHGQLQKMIKTPICLDESITSLARAEDMITLGAGKIINIKPGRVGGFSNSIAIHDLCERHLIPVWCGGMLESGIGRAYNVALASLPNFRLPGDLSPSARYWERDLVLPEWTMSKKGLVKVPVEPGLGVSVNLDLIDRFTQRLETLSL